MTCHDADAHDNPVLYCVWCGWTSEKLRKVGEGLAPKRKRWWRRS